MSLHVPSAKHLSFVPCNFLMCLLFHHWYSFFIARLVFPHSVPAFSRFPWLVPPSHSLLACHGGIRAITTVPHRPAARKKKKKKSTSSPCFFHNGLGSPSPGQAVSHCSKLTGGVGGDSEGGVLLISRASTFYSLRQSWLPLFGCQYKSRGSTGNSEL